LKNLIKSFYSNNFVYKGKEKHSKLTILVLVFLNIFVLTILYQGIDFQTRVINNPNTKFPYDCRDILNYNTTIDDFNNYIYYSYNYDSQYQNIKDLEIDERCNLIFEKIKLIKENIDIQSLKNKNDELYNKSYNISSEISYLKDNYNTLLFEKLSDQKTDKSIIKGDLTAQNVKDKYEKLSKELEELNKQKEDLKANFKEERLVKDIVLYLENNKEFILEDIKKSEKYYSIKYELVILLFLVPLVLIFFYLMKNYLKKDRYVLYIIFKNILFVTMIPTLISFFSLINIFIPKIFMEKLLMFFYNLEIPFVVYYLAIVILVLISIFIIIRIQKRFKENSDKLKNNNITFVESYNKNLCNKCGNRIDYNVMNFCPCCQNELKVECKSCKKMSLKQFEFCFNCGDKM